jgi:hypothetical protein
MLRQIVGRKVIPLPLAVARLTGSELEPKASNVMRVRELHGQSKSPQAPTFRPLLPFWVIFRLEYIAFDVKRIFASIFDAKMGFST